ncbi:hypothetical protein VKT23_002669 [Stygiomarasmius scandens]|uniref:F-box domain-containing protein n=1 Tax=Marasmiellus scandens TaxID=2682957 RepID=A0ABR1K4K0_9AGAR
MDPFDQGSTFCHLRSFSSLPSPSEACTITEIIKNIQHDKKLLQNYSSIISSLRRIPPELWSRIFLLVYDASPHTFQDIFRSMHPNLQLTSICPFFRAVALETPQLWSTLIIDLHYIALHDSYLEQTVYLLSLFLERSGTYPLYIRLTSKSSKLSYRTTQVSTYERTVQSILSLLFTHGSHWADVRITVEDRYITESLLSRIRGNLPMLHSLDLTVPESSGTINRWTLSTDAFLSTPSLWSLTLPQCPSSLKDQFPLGQITHLTIARFCPYDSHFYNEILPRMSSLTALVLGYRYTFADGSVRPGLCSPQLVSLTIYIDEYNNNSTKYLFPPVSLPRLKELKILSRRHCGFSYTLPLYPCARWDQEEFLGFWRRSSLAEGEVYLGSSLGEGEGLGFRLTRLELANIMLRPGPEGELDMIGLLRVLSSLQYVKLLCGVASGKKKCVGTKTFFKYLLYDPLSYQEDGVMVPGLKELEVALDSEMGIGIVEDGGGVVFANTTATAEGERGGGEDVGEGEQILMESIRKRTPALERLELFAREIVFSDPFWEFLSGINANGERVVVNS